MKTARCLVFSTLVSAALMSRAIADGPETDDSSRVPVDQDGIPLSVTHPEQKQPTPDEIEAYQKMQAQMELNKDWLLRAYEKQRQLHSSTSPVSDNDLYYRLISNKDLAGLAGLPALEPAPDQAALLRTGTTQGTLTLRSDPSGGTAPRATYKPLITPFGSPGAIGLRSFYSTLPATSSPSLLPGNNSPKISPVSVPREEQDPTDIETPGLIAAEKDPLLDKTSANLTLDLLAHDPAAQTDSPEDHSPTKLELPLPTNAALLRKTQEAALSVPGLVKSTAVTPVHPTLPLVDPNEPIPISRMPQANPVRSPIADPRDIFYR